jgi:hypothetical protein
VGKAVLVVIVLGLVIYTVIRLLEKLRAARRTGPSRPVQPPQRRVVAPDDDPDFLRELERRRRRRPRDGQPDTPDS